MCEICSLGKKKKSAAEHTSLKKPSKSGGHTRCSVSTPTPQRSCMWGGNAVRVSSTGKGAAALKASGKADVIAALISWSFSHAEPRSRRCSFKTLPNSRHAAERRLCSTASVFDPAPLVAGGMIVLDAPEQYMQLLVPHPVRSGTPVRRPAPFDSCSQWRRVGMSHATEPAGS